MCERFLLIPFTPTSKSLLVLDRICHLTAYAFPECAAYQPSIDLAYFLAIQLRLSYFR